MKTKIVAFVLSLLMVISIMPVANVEAATNSVYSYEGYDVIYSINSTWEEGQNIEIEVVNTGSVSILNWGIKFDAKGDVHNIWNARVMEQKENSYIIRNDEWNYEIEAGKSVKFGYTLLNYCSEKPSSFELLSKEVEVVSGIDVELNVLNDWGTGFQGELQIRNSSEKNIEAWTLSMDTNFVLADLWGGKLEKMGEYSYKISCEVWSNTIKAGETRTIGFTALKEVKYEPSLTVSSVTQVVIDDFDKDSTEESIQLRVNASEFLSDDTYKTIYFYATASSGNVTSIELIDDNNNIISTMLDDGNYNLSGDDIAGDGVYSTKYEVYADSTKDVKMSFCAVLNGNCFSNMESVFFYAPFTEEELKNMEYVFGKVEEVLSGFAGDTDTILLFQDAVDGNGFANLYEEKYAAVYNTLEELKNKGHLYSFVYNEYEKQFECQYPNGIRYVVSLIDYVKYDETECGVPPIPEVVDKNYAGYSIAILNSFENERFRTKFYEDLEETYVEKGLVVSYDDYVTVNDLKTALLDKDIICLSGHGAIYGNKSVWCLLDDKATSGSMYSYTMELKSKRIAYWTTEGDGTYYVLFKEFIEHYYAGKKLDGSIIFAQPCNFFGNQDIGLYYDFAKAFVDSGALSVAGYHNSVMSVYGRNFMVHYIDSLLEGDDCETAHLKACAYYGNTDYEYRKPSFLEYLINKNCFENMGPSAIAMLYGDKSAKLIKPLQNGDFEKVYSIADNKPSVWECKGDVRLLDSLGDIKPFGSRMTFVSTGIGSETETSLGGTQGSSVGQSFYNEEYNQIQFNYNFISEEPMEYVGSVYNDGFYVRITYGNGSTFTQAIETVNTASWYPVTGVNFDGGDNTIYQTRWRTGAIDISKYKNQNIKVEFLVCDVGDSAFDSAVVIDNIECIK